MKKIITLLFLFLFAYITTKPALAYELEAGSSASLKDKHIFKTTQNKEKVSVLNKYLDQFNSPLPAQSFITVSQKYNLDWKLLPAISGVESTFGKHIPYESYNPFGWGNGKSRFDSWEHAIETVGRGLRENYMDRWGADTIEAIWPIYAPPSKTWGKNVRFFMEQIDQFEKTSSSLALNFSL